MKEEKEIKVTPEVEVVKAEVEDVTPEVVTSYGVVEGPSIDAENILSSPTKAKFWEGFCGASSSVKSEVAKALGKSASASRKELILAFLNK